MKTNRKLTVVGIALAVMLMAVCTGPKCYAGHFLGISIGPDRGPYYAPYGPYEPYGPYYGPYYDSYGTVIIGGGGGHHFYGNGFGHGGARGGRGYRR